MAELHTTGLHEPSALPYLISEGLLPSDADPSTYRWAQQLSLDEYGNVVQEEIAIFDYCVVWSRGKIVKRVFNLDVENETILHAFATSFPTSPVKSEETYSAGTGTRPLSTKERALVVVLKTQAHVFCLSGGIHVIPLPFVAARAFPFSQGCIFQPQNPQEGFRPQGATRSSILTPENEDGPFADPALLRLLETHDPAMRPNVPSLRRLPTYCITDLFAEVGLVAASHSRKAQQDLDTFLPIDEEVIYMSSDSDVVSMHLDKNLGTCIAVTINRSSLMFTIWSVVRNSAEPDAADRLSDTSRYRRRQSTTMHDRSRAASGRAPNEPSRESLGGLIQSFVDKPVNAQEARLSNIEHLAAELQDEFEPGGVQTRSSRRISSMLARSELAPPTERSAFNDTVRGVGSRKSLSKSLRREGSFGSFTDRNSFGGRRSFPVASSVMSNATSFLGPADRISFGEAVGAGIGESNFRELESNVNRLRKDITFCKIKSFSCHDTTARNTESATKVLVITHPRSFSAENTQNPQISVCIQERKPQVMTVVTIAIKATRQKSRLGEVEARRPELKAVQVQKGNNIADACVVRDDIYSRLVVLSKTSQDDDVLHLEAPWSPSFRLDLPQHYLIHPKVQPFRKSTEGQTGPEGLHRTLGGSDVKVAHFLTTFNLNSFVIRDTKGRHHELRIELCPKSKLGKEVLQICRFILPAQHQDSLLVAFWEVRRWLDTQEVQGNLENIAITVMLFSMAVPFISTFQEKPLAPNRKKKIVNLRSRSGSLVDATKWSLMQIDDVSLGAPAWTHNGAWVWLGARLNPVVVPKSPSRHFRASSLDQDDNYANRVFLSQCIDLTRDFLQSPAGENMSGTEGYLPCAINQDRNIRRTALASIVVALFLLLQEHKLEVCADQSTTNESTILTILIAQLGWWLRWSRWKDSMLTEYECRGSAKDSLQLDPSKIDNLDVPPEPFKPMSIFEYVQTAMHSTPPKFHMLVDLLQSTEELAESDSVLTESMKLLPKSSALVHFFSGKHQQVKSDTASTVLGAILTTHKSTSLSVRAGSQTGEEHLSHNQRHRLNGAGKKQLAAPQALTQTLRQPLHVGIRDTHTLGIQAVDAESFSRWDVTSEMERQTVTKLIFHQDRRFQEASKLVNQTRAPEIEFEVEPSWTEANALEAQKQLAQYATRRTFAVATGRGMMHFNARTPLLTEMVPVPKFSLQCIMRSKDNSENGQPMTFSADRSQFTEEKVYWAFFHNGASAGLMISKEADFIDTSWILYNKPADLTNRHAGLLLALGLNGHLKSLAKWVAFKYLTPKHTMTTVGLLLGIAASYKGTADTLVTRLLSVHITCLLPPGAAELNLSPLTQMTGIMGIGLVYYDTQHRRMSEVMLSEIESQDIEERSGDEPILRNEGYRLVAGMSLGLINLGHGSRLHGLHDMRLVERLLAIAVGTKNINLVHVLDRATAGAVLALAFIFMKTNDISVARKVDVPDTTHQFEYVRPDVFLLRTLARHLIMWNKIEPTTEFVQESLPSSLRHRIDFRTIKRLVTNDLPFFHVVAGICFAISLRFSGSQNMEARDLLVEYLDQFLRLSRLPAHSYDAKVTLNGIRNCLDILALSCATVMAGSGDIEIFRRLRALHGRTDKDTPYGSHLAAHMAIGALFLSGGTATFGTSNLATASLVIAFYPLFPTEILDNRGHLQALRHLWVLAVEHRCVIVRNGETGQVIGNIDAAVTFNNGTTATFRTPGLLPDLDSIRSIAIVTEDYWPFEANLNQSVSQSSTSNSDSKGNSRKVRDEFKFSSTGIHITLQPRPIYDKLNTDPFDSELQALESGQRMPQGTYTTAQNSGDSKNPIDWIFAIPTFKALDHAERALVLTGSGSATSHATAFSSKLLQTTPVDIRLELELNTIGPESSRTPNSMRKGMKSDKLWLLRIMLSWADKVDAEIDGAIQKGDVHDGEGVLGDEKAGSLSLRKEVVERLRWRVWNMCNGQDNEGDRDADDSGEQDYELL